MAKGSADVPKKIHDAGVSEWYLSLSDRDRTILRRYLSAADGSSPAAFFTAVIGLAADEENCAFASSVGDTASRIPMTGMERFLFNEELIPAYMSSERFSDARTLCDESISLYPEIAEEFVRRNGGVPLTLNCRNRLIDIMVGIDGDYDGAVSMLERFFDLGMIDAEELTYRRNSLKIHRMQRVFDGVYAYRPKE